jgi:hypothetical protein
MTSVTKRKDLSIPITSAYAYMLPIVMPLLGVMIAVHILIWGVGDLIEGLSQLAQLQSAIPVLVLGIPLHEFIHAFSWVLFGGISFQEINFGFDWKSLAPYAHATEPLKARAYRLGAAMPALLMGGLPYLIGIISGWAWFTNFGIFYVLAAGGDLVVLWLLRDLDGEARVEDHPTRAGCYVYA